MLQAFKSLFRHGSIYSLGNMVSKLVGFLMIPLYTSYLKPVDYGVLELLTLVTSIVSMVLALRITSGLTRFYRDYEDAGSRNSLVSTAIIFIIFLSIIAALVFIHFSESISLFVFQSADYQYFFVLIFISLAFELAASVTFAYLQILEKSLFFISISLMQLTMGLTLNIYFLVVAQLGVAGILYSMIISNGVTCILLLAYNFRMVRWGFDWGKLKQMISFSLPLIPAGMMIFVLNMGDRFLLNRLSSLEEVGVYALGYKFGMILGLLIGGPFNSIWGPKRVEIYNDQANRDEIFSRVFTYVTLVLAFAGLAISILIKEILMVIAAPEYWEAYKVVPLVTLGYLFYIVYYIVDVGFYFQNKTSWYLIINATAAVSNVVLNLILIPYYGAMGAASVTAASFFLCPLIAYFVSQHYYSLKYDFGRLGKLVLVTGICYIVGSTIETDSVAVNIILKMSVIFSMPFLLYLIGFFEARELGLLKAQLQRAV